METSIILPSFYLPPIVYFKVLKYHKGQVLIEKHENYVKQSYRTRTVIGTSNGPLKLIVPTVHIKQKRRTMKDLEINYDFDWQRLHWLSLETAYRTSPYFEYYEDEFRDFYKRREKYILDLNFKQLELILRLLKMDIELSYTESYTDVENQEDYRKIIHPKSHVYKEGFQQYYQIFAEKNGFMTNLSIVDLLFHQGPKAADYL